MQKISSTKEYSLKNHGDGAERIYCDRIINDFPNYEKFWHFIVPWTNRDILPETDPNWLKFRDGIPPDLEELFMAHYSVFRCLVFFLDEIGHSRKVIGDHELLRMAYAHFGYAIEMSYFIAAKIQMLKGQCGLIDPKSIFKMKSKDNLLVDFKDFVKKNYKAKFDDYKNKQIPIQYMVSGTRSFLRDIVDNKGDLRMLENYFRSVQEYRNKLIHSPLPGTLYLDQKKLVVKKGALKKYTLWTDITRQMEHDLSDFSPEEEFLEKEFSDLKVKLNVLWKYLLKGMKEIYKTEFLVNLWKK